MTSALYGRMSVGRCLQSEREAVLNWNDPRVLGCSADVLPVFDQRCSGRNQCDVKLVSDSDLQQQMPCHSYLKSYLQATYDCVTGTPKNAHHKQIACEIVSLKHVARTRKVKLLSGMIHLAAITPDSGL